jgi:hypothetical protein
MVPLKVLAATGLIASPLAIKLKVHNILAPDADKVGLRRFLSSLLMTFPQKYQDKPLIAPFFTPHLL